MTCKFLLLNSSKFKLYLLALKFNTKWFNPFWWHQFYSYYHREKPWSHLWPDFCHLNHKSNRSQKWLCFICVMLHKIRNIPFFPLRHRKSNPFVTLRLDYSNAILAGRPNNPIKMLQVDPKHWRCWRPVLPRDLTSSVLASGYPFSSEFNSNFSLWHIKPHLTSKISLLHCVWAIKCLLSRLLIPTLPFWKSLVDSLILFLWYCVVL